MQSTDYFYYDTQAKIKKFNSTNLYLMFKQLKIIFQLILILNIPTMSMISIWSSLNCIKASIFLRTFEILRCIYKEKPTFNITYYKIKYLPFNISQFRYIFELYKVVIVYHKKLWTLLTKILTFSKNRL